ncbi:peptidase E [Leifsonia sp. NPDC080035]|uniref:Peptidase E n=1 Tax=Leifsonia sp. NPDC080035 TaxID=3143936 RepID=A0AAU7GGC3_9MICO
MTAGQPTIVATCGGLTGGAWTDSAYGPLLEHAIELARVQGRPPRVTHINTAGGDQRHIEGAELEAARAAGVDATHLRLFPHPNLPDMRAHLLAQDVIWVSGGSLANLLALWRLHGLDQLLAEAWRAGVVLAGGSAGAVCWHEGGTTASFGPDISPLADGLGLVPGSLAVHYDSDPNRRPAHQRAVAAGVLPDGYALDEGVGLVYFGTELVDVVAERPGVSAWRVRRTDGGTGANGTEANGTATNGTEETRIVPRVLGRPVSDSPAASTPSTTPSTIEEARTPR